MPRSDFAPIDLAAVKADRRSSGRPEATDVAVRAALAQIDQGAIFDEEEASFVVEEWDHQTTINGVPPAKVYASRHDVTPRSTVYLLKDAETGRVIVFQPFKPHVEGFQPIQDAQAEGAAHRAEIANARARSRVIEQVNKALEA